ncbi:hypothetical protein ACHAXR_011754 [Thalassiosira sp. AJA248-18]
MNTSKNEGTNKVVIVGTGDKSKGLTHMYECHANKGGLFNVVVTEPLPLKRTEPFHNCISVEKFPEALGNADIVILALPSYVLESFLVQNYSLLKERCILVDLTNASKKNNDLKGAIDALNLDCDRWVKAFNDTGAIQEMQHHVTSKTKLSTQICGPNEDNVNEIYALAKELGYSADVVPFDQYEELQSSGETIGWEWIHATVVMLILFLSTMVYVMIQASGRRRFEWYQIMCRYTSKMFAWTCMYGFTFSMLPGTLIRLLNQVGYPRATPRVLIWGCNIRKHIGLLSLYFLFLHACMMVLLFGSEYFGFLLREGHMEWNDEASMLTAVLSTSLFIITGIASLPSVGNAMNKAQFMLVFGPIVWIALALGVMHVMFLGVESWTETPRSPYSWTRDMPPVTLMASVFPLLAMFLKSAQICMSWVVAVKKGFANRHGEDSTEASIHASDHLFTIDDDNVDNEF